MSFKEVNELRKSGKLDDAFEMAEADLRSDPDNIWAKRAISWVYFERLKLNSSLENYTHFLEDLKAIGDLHLDEDNVMLFDSCAWQIGSLVFKLQKEEKVNFEKIEALFENLRSFTFTKPSTQYSLLYKAFHKNYMEWSRYLEFADWWGFENFEQQDYQSSEYNGNKIMALVEQAVIAYSKKLIQGERDDIFDEYTINKDKIIGFIPFLENIIESYPEYQYPSYFMAKLLLKIDDNNSLKKFLPFAKRKKNEFWVWDLMAEIHAEDEEIRFSCYCKALSTNASDEFLIKLRQSFVKQLISKQMYKEAKTEIEFIIKTRNKEGWNIPSEVTQWTQLNWFISIEETNRNNNKFYNENKNVAEALLYSDISEKIIVIEFVNENKNIVNFIASREEKGFFSYKFLKINPVVGKVYNARIESSGDKGYHKVFTISESDEIPESLIRMVSGNIKKREGQAFAFINDVFIEPNILRENNLTDNSQIQGKAMITFNKKKGEWGWKLISIE